MSSPTRSPRARPRPWFAARTGDGGAGSRRSRRRFPANDSVSRGSTGGFRSVVDHDDLVLVGVEPVLTAGSERRERAGELTGHVVDDDDDAQAHLGTAASTPRGTYLLVGGRGLVELLDTA